MKHSLSFIAMLLIFASCQKPEKASDTLFLTGIDSANVTKEISAATDAWLDAYLKMDPDKAAQFWDSSPQMMYAENGEKFANWDSIHAAIKGIYITPVESMDLNFQPRDILPLSYNTAHVFMPLYFRVKYKSGQLFQGKGFQTLLVVKKSGTWKILRGHESWKPGPSK
jgi:ketosteroid isomerase-like protein